MQCLQLFYFPCIKVFGKMIRNSEIIIGFTPYTVSQDALKKKKKNWCAKFDCNGSADIIFLVSNL